MIALGLMAIILLGSTVVVVALVVMLVVRLVRGNRE